MKLSNLGLSVLEFIEQFRAIAYRRFPNEPWTAGYGHTGPDVHQGTVCTRNEARTWLAGDVGHAEVAVMRAVDVSMTQHQFDALVSFTYNAGEGALRGSTLLKLLNAGKPLLAAEEFLKWDHVGAVESDGLESRRIVERALFLDGLST